MDTSSAKALAKSLPGLDEQTGLFLSMESLTPKAVERETAALAKHGFLGCFPLGKYHDTWVVIRLLPEVPLARCPVGQASKVNHEGETMAPDLARVVAGAIAWLDPEGISEYTDEKDVLATAALFGDRPAAERVLALVKKPKKKSTERRTGALFAAADSGEPWFQVLGAAWSKKGKELSTWVKSASKTHGGIDLVHRLAVSVAVEEESAADISESAWRCITGDVVFDATYNGSMPGPWLNSFDASPFVHAAKWLDAKKPAKLDPVQAASLKAALAFAEDPEGYDGAAHLEAATGLASTHARAAFTHAENAAMFHVRGEHGTPKKAIALALRIAKEQGWDDLATVLKWGS